MAGRRSLSLEDQPTARVHPDGRVRNTIRSPEAMATSANPGDGSKRLLNWKWELFARAVAVKNMDPTEAWYAIHDPDRKKKSAYAKKQGLALSTTNPVIVARIQYLTDQSILRDTEQTTASREWVNEEMVSTYRRAADDGAWAAAVKALELLGIEQGMFVRRTSIQKTSTPIDASNREELVEQFVRLARDAFGPIDGGALRALFAKATGVTIEVPAEKPTIPAEASPDTIGDTAGNA